MDGHGTYDPRDIWRLLSHADRYSHVIGARDKKHIGSVHTLGNSVISRLFSLLFGVNITDVRSGMYLLQTSEAENYNLDEPGFVAEIELAAQSAASQQLVEVPIIHVGGPIDSHKANGEATNARNEEPKSPGCHRRCLVVRN
jgi:dolichol-phosphate mannosyltransferase